MSKMTHEMLTEFTDEDRWLIFFTKKTFAVMGISGVILILLINLFTIFKIQILGWAIGIILAVILTGITIIYIPGENYLKGAGMTLDQLLWLHIIRKKKTCIYVKGNFSKKTEMLDKQEEKWLR